MPEFHDTDPNDRAEGEPEGGWVTSPTLQDTELLVTTLCRFTGKPVGHEEFCMARAEHQHPDEECRALYFQAQALQAGTVNLEGFSDIPEEIRVPFSGGELSGGEHG